eukprot:TRINITY_DN3142_c0_g1_i1.p2 TRINITY_DN3142_c0_g1~~TRINITY_DN3142_c0_g1_i1.p2  ORF type:complete len:489 (-),score=170.02 TRINITY_DN3142_c0_g1_i1:83-1549(-)
MPKDPVDVVQEASKAFVAHLSTIHCNFPSVAGSEFSTSILNENDDRNLQLENENSTNFYSFDPDAMFSVVEIPSKTAGENKARLFIRDPAVKQAWDFKLNYGSAPSEMESVQILFPPTEVPTVPKRQVESHVALGKKPPIVYKEGHDLSTSDKMADFLEHLGENHREIIPEGLKNFNQPTLLPKQFLSQIVNIQTAFAQQSSDDAKCQEEKLRSRPSLSSYAALPPKPVVPQFPEHNGRLLLSHLGVLDPFNDTEIIENFKNFQLCLRNLDQQFTREIQKVGLIYVSEGQEDQQDIFRNSKGSANYEEFVSGLGWPVALDSHKGYAGGLHSGSNGKDTPYFANPLLEVVYHEVVRLPTVPEDAQQLHKKRHVGNDTVHIVWSEHGRDYNPKTITSQFNDAHIIIYPLSNGLFRIQIARKEKVMLFGPLIHGMTVTKKNCCRCWCDKPRSMRTDTSDTTQRDTRDRFRFESHSSVRSRIGLESWTMSRS